MSQPTAAGDATPATMRAIVVTRPGSFGDPASLVRVADHLLGHPSASRTASTHTATSAVSGATTEENS